MNSTEEYERDALLMTALLFVPFMIFSGFMIWVTAPEGKPYERQFIQHQTGIRGAP